MVMLHCKMQHPAIRATRRRPKIHTRNTETDTLTLAIGQVHSLAAEA